jgi:hypothetical protein
MSTPDGQSALADVVEPDFACMTLPEQGGLTRAAELGAFANADKLVEPALVLGGVGRGFRHRDRPPGAVSR